MKNRLKYIEVMKMMMWMIIAAAIVIFDQTAKFLVTRFIGAAECIHVIPGLFDFVYVKNTGAAFSILSKNTALLSVISVVFCIGVIAYWYRKRPTDKLLCLSLTMLFAGAFGNAVDRIIRGYVIDFIETAFIRFPVFNIADISITCGAVILLIYLIFFDKDGENGKNNSDSIESGKAQD